MTTFSPADLGGIGSPVLAAVLLTRLGPDPAAAVHVMQLRWALGDFCTRPACDGKHRALGLCDAHYRAHRRATRNEAHTINREAVA